MAVALRIQTLFPGALPGGWGKIRVNGRACLEVDFVFDQKKHGRCVHCAHAPWHARGRVYITFVKTKLTSITRIWRRLVTGNWLNFTLKKILVMQCPCCYGSQIRRVAVAFRVLFGVFPARILEEDMMVILIVVANDIAACLL